MIFDGKEYIQVINAGEDGEINAMDSDSDNDGLTDGEELY